MRHKDAMSQAAVIKINFWNRTNKDYGITAVIRALTGINRNDDCQ